MGLGEILESVRDEPSQKFTSSLIKNIKCNWRKEGARLSHSIALVKAYVTHFWQGHCKVITALIGFSDTSYNNVKFW